MITNVETNHSDRTLLVKWRTVTSRVGREDTKSPEVEFHVEHDGTLSLWTDDDTADTGSQTTNVIIPDEALPAIIAFLQQRAERATHHQSLTTPGTPA